MICTPRLYRVANSIQIIKLLQKQNCFEVAIIDVVKSLNSIQKSFFNGKSNFSECFCFCNSIAKLILSRYYLKDFLKRREKLLNGLKKRKKVASYLGAVVMQQGRVHPHSKPASCRLGQCFSRHPHWSS